jgi:prepilin-type N-terminal cleavage/methylation domain-containing protein
MTLAEVVVALGVASLTVVGLLGGYISSMLATEKASLSLAANARAFERLEDTHGAIWNVSSWPVVDQLAATNFPAKVVILDLSGQGAGITYGTNYTTITQVSLAPQLRRVSRGLRLARFQTRQLSTLVVEHRGRLCAGPIESMKPSIRCGCSAGPWRSGERAFTLPEMMVSMAIFLLLVGGMMAVNLFGMRLFQFEEIKLVASSQARRIVGGLTDEIHSCETFQIGTVSNGTFTGLPLNAAQTGPALIVYPNTNSGKFIVYYVNTADRTFRRATSLSGSTRILAQSVTNATGLFRAQDYLGNLLTNIQDNTVLHLKSSFIR